MSQKIKSVLKILGVVIFILVIIFLMFELILSPSIISGLSLAVSILALLVSLISSFKNEIFPFNLTAFIDGFYIFATPALPPSSGISLGVLLPITFFNRGYSEGVIETVRLMVKANGDKKQTEFIPSVEIDMAALIQQGKGINMSNSSGMFVGFLLETKRAVKKNIVFTPSVQPGASPMIWKPSVYDFELHIKVLGEKQPKKVHLKQEIHNTTLTMLATGQAPILFLYSDPKN